MCSVGHETLLRADQRTKKGRQICKVCTRKDPATAEARFRKVLADLGATTEFDRYEGAFARPKVLCRMGHACYVQPCRVNRGPRGICATCHGGNPEVQEAEFVARLRSAGAEPAYEKWEGSKAPHRATCAAGHTCFPRPNGIQSGRNPCRKCCGKVWDIFYVVQHGTRPEIKFGIGSGKPNERLNAHRRNGFTRVILVKTSLPGTVAPDTERAVKMSLRGAGHSPVNGREYFALGTLPLVMKTATTHLSLTLTQDVLWLRGLGLNHDAGTFRSRISFGHVSSTSAGTIMQVPEWCTPRS